MGNALSGGDVANTARVFGGRRAGEDGKRGPCITSWSIGDGRRSTVGLVCSEVMETYNQQTGDRKRKLKFGMGEGLAEVTSADTRQHTVLGPIAVFGMQSGELQIRTLDDLSQKKTILADSKEPFTQVHIATSDTVVAACATSVRSWSIENGAQAQVFEAPSDGKSGSGTVTALAYCSSNECIAIGMDDGSIRLHHLLTGAWVCRLPGPATAPDGREAAVSSLLSLPGHNTLLALYGAERQAWFWDFGRSKPQVVDLGAEHDAISLSATSIECACYDEPRSLLFTATDNGAILVHKISKSGGASSSASEGGEEEKVGEEANGAADGGKTAAGSCFTLQLVKAYNSVAGRASPSTISYNTRKDVVLVGDVLGLVKILDGISGLSLIPVDVAGQAAPAESEDDAFLGIKEDDAGNKTVAV